MPNVSIIIYSSNLRTTLHLMTDIDDKMWDSGIDSWCNRNGLPFCYRAWQQLCTTAGRRRASASWWWRPSPHTRPSGRGCRQEPDPSTLSSYEDSPCPWPDSPASKLAKRTSGQCWSRPRSERRRRPEPRRFGCIWLAFPSPGFNKKRVIHIANWKAQFNISF